MVNTVRIVLLAESFTDKCRLFTEKQIIALRVLRTLS
jgi:hypothetical protein